MNNMTEKLIKDGSENARIKMNLLGIKIGGALLALSFISLIAGLFLAPVAAEGYFGTAFTAMLCCGVIAFLVVGIKNMADALKNRKQQKAAVMAAGGLLVLIGIALYFFSLATEKISAYIGFAGIAAGIILIIAGALTAKHRAGK